ncbi:Erythronolide synthase, modules 1 and 2 [Vibrio ruber DSM 16370]|uniref:Erythronolide synthase, modules 1 and 2 n=1 Tax=Vibrio ruber (strain DSM 16370 / JCM 11486 / BCRC 17186 / CECT 7878 / LMG 23124 / VR1) TaxID=1123498 RepID=A0A1R4LF44_VIBR1|nr:type I polyketide synthase [Vibrio ruber]SJN54914.1 Erythronolide synthase, modules 1 and 2 [Vibrio ruber DSM 16370]
MQWKSEMRQCVQDLVTCHPEERMNDYALIFLDHTGQRRELLTYIDLKTRCLAAARQMRHRTNPGDVVLIAIEDQCQFVIGFFACLLAGCVPAPLPAFRHQNDKQTIGRIRAIVQAGDATILLLPVEQQALAQMCFADLPLNILCVTSLIAPEADSDSSEPLVLPEVSPQDIAYIQYTSGSTSQPKGVCLTHTQVLANLDAMGGTFQRQERVRMVGWLPLHHDMGLVGHLFTVLNESGQGYFLPPASFLAAPDVWLAAVHRYRGNLAAVPAFAIDDCLRRVTTPDPQWDLSCLKYLYVGSETVDVGQLTAFVERFQAVGIQASAIYPVYGLAEATLLVAGGMLSLAALEPYIMDKSAGSVQWRLTPYPLSALQQDIGICDPASGTELPPGQEGEIIVRSPSIFSGYYQSDSGQLPGGVTALHTGDLGLLVNGCLYITGRLKETVILRGVSYHAEDLEMVAKFDHDSLRSDDKTACVGHVVNGHEQLVIFQEIQRHTPRHQYPAIVQTMQANLSDNFGIQAQAIHLIAAGLMPKTPNHKLARNRCMALYLSGELKTLYSSPEVPVGKVSASSATSEADDAVVIVGMACRFPGGVETLEQFWQMLCEGRDGITKVPATRWDNSIFFDPQVAVPGKMNTRWAGLTDHIDQFDPALFGISPYEAAEVDPQQRMLLETSWRLLEHAGVTKADLKHSDTGVFIGIANNDYLYLKIKLSETLEGFNAYSGLGNANSIAANRLSYFYDLKGPSVAIDTACSSSLTAFNYGLKAIRDGECEQAIVGGVNAIISPGTTVTLSQFGMMSPKGRCKAFDASADGYVRAEGCGLVMLKRRSAAMRDGDRILAEVKGCVAAQDGQSAGMTFPNGTAQHRLIRKTLQQAGLTGSEVRFIEAHGTGTPTGDPVEMEQLVDLYGGPGGAPCYVGSVKANIGHLESAAGIAGVIKVVLMLNRHIIPPQVHFSQLNPRIHLEHSRLMIPVEARPWEDRHKVAAVSSFGFGGSLAHAILAAPEPVTGVQTAETGEMSFFADYKRASRDGAFYEDICHEGTEQLFVLSHHSAGGLLNQARCWSEFLETPPLISLADLTTTQAQCRTHLRYRKAFVADSHSGLQAQLAQFVSRQSKVTVPADMSARVCFLFSGQGGQYLHMGETLYQTLTVFRQAFDRCAKAWAEASLPGQTLLGEHQDRHAQSLSLQTLAFDTPADNVVAQCYQPVVLFAIQYALGIAWQACGVMPYRLLGHSLGEYTAACLAGCFSPETGVRLLKKRAELVVKLAAPGTMVTLFAGKAEVAAALGDAPVQIAVVNSPGKTVIAGPEAAVRQVAQQFSDRGVQVQPLPVPYAYHCHLLDPVLAAFNAYASQFTFLPPVKYWISSTTATRMTEAPTAAHWVRHMRETVLFSDAVGHLAQDNVSNFLEIGPGTGTLVAVRECLTQPDLVLLRSLSPPKGGKTERAHFLESAGRLYEQGVDLIWQSLLAGEQKPDQIPGLVFDHQRYWLKGLEPENIAAFAGPIYGRHLPISSDASASAGRPVQPARYDLVWVKRQPVPHPEDVVDLRTRLSWLLVGPDSAILQSLSAQIRARGHQVFWLSTDGADRHACDACLLPQAETADAFVTLNHILTSRSRADIEAWKVVYLSDEDTLIAPDQLALPEMDQALRTSLGGLIVLLKALRQVAITPPVWVVTRMSQQLMSDAAEQVNLSAAPIWGFAKTLYLEHPEWRGGMIDLDAGTSADTNAAGLMAKILHPGSEHCVVFRQGDQYVEQLAPVSAPSQPSETVTFRDDGVFVITGGLGGLGLKTAQWVIDKGARHLILISRQSLPPEEQWVTLTDRDPVLTQVQQLQVLRAQQVIVEVVSLDVRNPGALTGLVQSLAERDIPVRGLIHAAGVNWFDKIIDLDPEAFFDTLQTKIAATWQLHQLSLSMDLDCFLLYSSVSALWGSVNLSHYTAANFFLDAVSLYRQGIGLPALSLDWGPWAEVGMSAKPEEAQILGKMGFTLMPPTDALHVMEEAMVTGRALSLIGQIDWQQYQSFIDFTLQPSLFEQVVGVHHLADAAVTQEHLQPIVGAGPAEARAQIKQIVVMELRSVMLIESVDDIPGDQRFNFLGMDSLMAILFATKLEQYFQVKLPNTLAYNYPHINAVTDYLFELVYQTKHPQTAMTEDTRDDVPNEATMKPQAAPAPAPTLPLPIAAVTQAQGKWFRVFKPITPDTQIVLYCFPYTGSGALVYQAWNAELPPGVALIGVQPPGKDERSEEPPYTDMHALIDDLMAHFDPPADLPFAFYGHSLGALMAFESCLALAQDGRMLPVHMILSGCNAPAVRDSEHIHGLPDDQFIDAVLEKYEGADRHSTRRLILARTITLLRADIKLLETYQPQDSTVGVPLQIIAGLDDPILSPKRVRQWVNFSTGDFELCYLPGGHRLVHEQQAPLLALIAHTLRDYLADKSSNPQENIDIHMVDISSVAVQPHLNGGK